MCVGLVEAGRCPFIERRVTFHPAAWLCCKLPIPKVPFSRVGVGDPRQRLRQPRKAPSGPPTRKVEHQMRQLAQDS